SVYPILRKSEKKVADYVLRNRKKASKMTLRELAEKTEVSQPTVMRMVKAAGFNGYKEFCYHLTHKPQPDGAAKADSVVHPWDTFEETASKVITSSIRLLEETLRAANIRSLERAIDIISGAKTVSVYAVENSYAIAFDLASKLTYLGINCIIHSDAFMQIVSAANLTKADAAVCVSLSGKSIDSVEALKTAHKSGAKTIAVTNGTDSPLCRYADVILDTGNSDMKIYGNSIFSRVTQTAVVDMLYVGIILNDYELYSKRLIKREELVRDKHYTEKPENM
ncbi:MAG: MurR/RpiR family transcriptional regulator, partial [Candidatus Ornithomonoglobus sp.]